MERAPSSSDGSAELTRKVAQLEASLAQEKLKSEDLTQQLRQAKEHNVTVQLQAEAEEEAITLKLMRRLEQLKREKAMLATEVEQEEEFLTNTLQKRLAKVALEKEALEVKLLELKKQMDQLEHEKARLAKDKIDLEATLDSESEYIVNKLQVQLEKLGNEKKHLSREKSELQRQVEELGRSVEKLNRDKIKLEQEMEMEEESIVNRLQRQLELVLGSIRLIETKLEAKGMTMKDLGITPFEFAAPETLRIYSRSPSSASSVDRWHSPHNSQQLGSSPSGHTATSLGSRSHRPGGGYMRVSNDMMRVSAGGASGGGSMELSGSKPTSSGEVTSGAMPKVVETAHSAPQMQTRRTSIGDVPGKV